MMQIQDGIGLSETEQVNIHLRWSTYGRVHERLQQEGFVALGTPPYACPGYIDQETVSSQNSRTITMMMAQCKAWRDYACQREVYSRQLLVEMRNELRSIEATTKKSMKDTATSKKTITVSDVKEEALHTQRYTQLLICEQEQEQLQEWYKAEASRFSSNFQLLSRTITIRGQDIEQGTRAGNVGAHGTGGSPGYDG